MLSNIFGGKKKREKFNYQKSIAIQKIIGPIDEAFITNIEPSTRAALKLYFYSNHIKGTGISTLDLIDYKGKGSLQNFSGRYELIAFTKHNTNFESSENEFMDVLNDLGETITKLSVYSKKNSLNPRDTMEIPLSDGTTSYVLFDTYIPNNKTFKINDEQCHLLLCLKIFEEELEFARKEGVEKLVNLLKNQGHYPYSDLGRAPVDFNANGFNGAISETILFNTTDVLQTTDFENNIKENIALNSINTSENVCLINTDEYEVSISYSDKRDSFASDMIYVMESSMKSPFWEELLTDIPKVKSNVIVELKDLTVAKNAIKAHLFFSEIMKVIIENTNAAGVHNPRVNLWVDKNKYSEPFTDLWSFPTANWVNFCWENDSLFTNGLVEFGFKEIEIADADLDFGFTSVLTRVFLDLLFSDGGKVFIEEKINNNEEVIIDNTFHFTVKNEDGKYVDAKVWSLTIGEIPAGFRE